MARVPRIQGRAVFGETEWQALSARQPWRGVLLVAHAWLVIGLAAALAIAVPNVLTITLAVLIIGSRQLGLAILMHDAAHGMLATRTRRNDLLGQWFCAVPTGIDLAEYRQYHLRHHAYAQQDEDPDLVLSAPFPVTRASLTRKVLRDLTGLTFLKLRVLPFVLALFGRYRLRRSDYLLLGFNVALALVAWSVGLLWAYALLWLAPAATWNMLVTRIRNIAEHACMTNDPDPWRVARTTQANWLARALIAPYYVNYHAEHHLFMSVPCYRLPAIHRALVASGDAASNALPVTPGYAAVLQEAGSA
ncbi:MAG: fatty acid desaturase family protein [Pseudomonadota bacterium]